MIQHIHQYSSVYGKFPPCPRLTELPLEIVQLVADCLQPPDAASFALCNRTLSTFLGSTYWKLLRHESAEASQRNQFLTTIARDLPQWPFCYRCSHLHPLNRIGPPGPLFQHSRPLRCFEERPAPTIWSHLRVHELASFYRFEFHHLHLAMERHRLGPQYGLSTDSLSFVEVQESGETDALRRMTTLLSVDARICAKPERLCLRIQNCVVWYQEDLELLQKRLECFWICHHLTDDLPLLIDRWAIPDADGSKMPKVEVRQCIHCKLDCQLEIDEFDNNGVLVIVTKWLDLGFAAGLVQHSCDSLAKNPFFPIVGPGWCGAANPSSEPGKVRLSFETEQGRLSQQALVLQNRSYLKEERYKEDIPKYCNGVWILQAGRPTPPLKYSDKHVRWLLYALGLLWSAFIGWCTLGKL